MSISFGVMTHVFLFLPYYFIIWFRCHGVTYADLIFMDFWTSVALMT